MKVFVYGTLRKGFYNHFLLSNSTFLGETETIKEDYTLKSLGVFPGVLLKGNNKIKGEVYKINRVTMDSLDSLEGFPDFYNKTLVDTGLGKAFMYYLTTGYEKYPTISSGDWKDVDPGLQVL